MNEQELHDASLELAEAQNKFVSTIYDLSGLVEKMIDHLSAFREYMQSWRQLFGDTRDLMETQCELQKESLESFKALARAITDSYVSANENNARMEKLITKVESYFGSGAGLDYDN